MKFAILLPFLLLLFAISEYIPANESAFLSHAKNEQAFNNLFQEAALDSVEERIRRIENGLLFPVVIKGQPSEPMKLADRMSFYKTPGVSIAFINNGRIEWARAYGVKKFGSNEPVTTETLFQAGSISKPVTAVMALQMVQDGRLSLDKDVNEMLVSWKVPENEFTKQEKVTVRRILSHSAGITNHAAGNYVSGAKLPTLLQILDGRAPANTTPIRVDIVPGTRWRYSGGGYGVLQQLIIDTGGTSFPALARKMIFDRLGMKHSTFVQPLPEKLWKQTAVGHDRPGNPVAGNWITFPEMAAAGLWTTPSDLARFALELQQSKIGKSNKILTARTTGQMVTKQIENWGLGFSVEGDGPTARFSHHGDTGGYKCFLMMYENTGQGVVIMTNSDRGDQLIDEILRSIAKEYAWSDSQPKEKTIVKIKPEVYDDYIGEYQFDFSADFTLTIGTQNGNLTYELKQPTGRSKVELYPESETTFFRKDVEVEIVFVRNSAGRVTHLIFRQNGQDLRVNRIK